MADFIENEGVEYPAQQAEDVVQEQPVVQEETQVEEQPQVEAVTEQAQEEPELIVLPPAEEEEQQEQVQQTTSEGVDLTEIFGDTFKSKDEAKQFVETLKSENEKLKQQTENVFANDTVKALNEYMKNGGAEEKEFLDTKYNQSKISTTIEQVQNLDPLAIVREDLKVNHGLTEDEIELYMTTENEVKLKIEGNKLKNNYLEKLNISLEQSKQQEADMVRNAQVRQQKFAEKIQSYVGDLKEVSGVQVDNTDKKTLLKNLSNPADFIRKYFPLDKDGMPTKDWVVNAAKLETHSRLVSVVSNKVKSAKAEGAKDVFNQLHNVPPAEATARVVQGQQEESAADAILKALHKNQTARHYN